MPLPEHDAEVNHKPSSTDADVHADCAGGAAPSSESAPRPTLRTDLLASPPREDAARESAENTPPQSTPPQSTPPQSTTDTETGKQPGVNVECGDYATPDHGASRPRRSLGAFGMTPRDDGADDGPAPPLSPIVPTVPTTPPLHGLRLFEDRLRRELVEGRQKEAEEAAAPVSSGRGSRVRGGGGRVRARGNGQSGKKGLPRWR